MIRFNLIEKLKLVFHIKRSQKNNKDQRGAGVIDERVDSTYINCEGIGLDAGIINKGKGMRSINSKWTATKK